MQRATSQTEERRIARVVRKEPCLTSLPRNAELALQDPINLILIWGFRHVFFVVRVRHQKAVLLLAFLVLQDRFLGRDRIALSFLQVCVCSLLLDVSFHFASFNGAPTALDIS